MNVDPVAAQELANFIINDSELYRGQTQAIIKNLAKKLRSGKFDAEKSVKLWRYLADNGAKKYIFEYGRKGNARYWQEVKGFDIFSVPTRLSTAKRLAAYYDQQIREEAGFKINPSGRRISRANLSGSRYVARPSQITRKRPTKRLVRRRRANLTAGAQGFFPNPQRGPSQIKRLTDTNAAGPWEFSFKGESGKWHFMNRYGRFNEAWQAATHFAEIGYPGTPVRLRDESKQEKTIYYTFRHPPMKTNPLGPKLVKHAKTLRDYGRRNLRMAQAANYLVQVKRGTQWKTLATFFAEQSARDYAVALHDRYPTQTIRVFRGGEPMRRNPSVREESPEVKAAAKLFQDFTGHRVRTGREVALPKAKAGLAVGPVLAVAYETTRDGKREKYLHEFAPRARPILAASSDGRSLFMLGGAYRFTDRGIVDKK